MNRPVSPAAGQSGQRHDQRHSHRLVPLSSELIDEVAAIEAMSSPSPWGRDLLAGELDLDDSARSWAVALEPDGTVVGFGGLMFVATDAHVLNIAVRPDRRRRGIAASMLAHLVDDARRRGVESLTLEVRVSNQAARVLYERVGFASAGVRPGYYGDGEDAEILWAHDLADVVARCEEAR